MPEPLCFREVSPLPCPLPEGFNTLCKTHRCPVTGLCWAPAERAISSLFCRCIFGSLDCRDLTFIPVPQLSCLRLGAPNTSGTG